MGAVLLGDSMQLNRSWASFSLVKKQEWGWPQAPTVLSPRPGSKGTESRAGSTFSTPGQSKLGLPGSGTLTALLCGSHPADPLAPVWDLSL